MKSERKGFSVVNLYFLTAWVGISLWALVWGDNFLAVMHKSMFFAYLMGFIKLFHLGTFGEMVKARLAKKTWNPGYIWERALVWGLFGLWFTPAFAYCRYGTEGLVTNGYWWDGGLALSKSLWINMFGGSLFR